MRIIPAAAITDVVADLCIKANTQLPPDIVSALDASRQNEPWSLAKQTLGLLWDNMELAEVIRQLMIGFGRESAKRTAMQHSIEKRDRIQTFFLLYWIPAKAQETNIPKKNIVIASMIANIISVTYLHQPFERYKKNKLSQNLRDMFLKSEYGNRNACGFLLWCKYRCD